MLSAILSAPAPPKAEAAPRPVGSTWADLLPSHRNKRKRPPNTAVFGSALERNPENVAFYGLLSEVDRKCDYDGDAMHLSLDVIVVGQRGPAGKTNTVDLTYFVAVTGPNQSILSKKPFTVRIAFDPDQIRAGVTDHIEEVIPLPGHKGTDLNILLGFQQNPDVTDFYKHFRGR